jgi:hypothetical protein
MKMVILPARFGITVNRSGVGGLVEMCEWYSEFGDGTVGLSDATCVKSGQPAAVQKLTVLRDDGHLK